MALKPSLLALALGLSWASALQAADLVTVYQHALDYDSELAAARATYQAQEEVVNEARSGLLPQVGAGASLSRNKRDSDLAGDNTYNSFGYSIELTQPLFRADTWYRYQGSKFASRQAAAQYVLEEQNLILRTADAYFSVLRAEENLATTKAAEEAFERQWEQAKQRFDVGLIAITEVLEAQALYDSAKVQRIAAEGDLAVALESLERLTGQSYPNLGKLREDFPVVHPEPNSPDEWVDTALQQNLEIQSATFAVDVAQQQLRTNRSLHYPTLDAFASYSDVDISGSSRSAAFNASSQNEFSIGLQLNVPLYTGGGTQAGVRRARFEVERAEQTLTTVRRNTTLNIRSLMRTLNTNIESIQARKQAIRSAESALEATRAGYQVGTRNIVEVLDAERLYYETLRDYANSRFDYVLNSLRLKQTAGILNPGDLEQLNRWLVETRS